MKTMLEGAAAALHSAPLSSTLDAATTAEAGLDQWPNQTPARVVQLAAARDAHEQSVVLRLLEIGLVPGETVQVVARGAWGGDPLAVRVGRTTFALRHQEAAMVRVHA